MGSIFFLILGGGHKTPILEATLLFSARPSPGTSGRSVHPVRGRTVLAPRPLLTSHCAVSGHFANLVLAPGQVSQSLAKWAANWNAGLPCPLAPVTMTPCVPNSPNPSPGFKKTLMKEASFHTPVLLPRVALCRNTGSLEVGQTCRVKDTNLPWTAHVSYTSHKF